MPPYLDQDEDDDYSARYRPRVPSRVVQGPNLTDSYRDYDGAQAESRPRGGGRLEALKGELHNIRDRFRDVKIEDMKEVMEGERLAKLEEDEKLKSKAQKAKPLDIYFAQYKGQGPPAGGGAKPAKPQAQQPQKAGAGATQAARGAAGRGRGAAAAQAAAPADHETAAKAYFDRTRRHYERQWHPEEQAEARAYFEEKRKMADAAWRMQHLLDAQPKISQRELGEQARLAREEAERERKERARSTGYLLPWGAPPKPKTPAASGPSRPLAADATPYGAGQGGSQQVQQSYGTYRHDSEAGQAHRPGTQPPLPRVSVAAVPSPVLSSSGAGSDTGSARSSTSSGQGTHLPVSFSPADFPEEPLTQHASYSGSGFGTTQSFEPLSPRWDGNHLRETTPSSGPSLSLASASWGSKGGLQGGSGEASRKASFFARVGLSSSAGWGSKGAVQEASKEASNADQLGVSASAEAVRGLQLPGSSQHWDDVNPRAAEEVSMAFPSSKLLTADAAPYVLTPLAVGPAAKAPTKKHAPKEEPHISYLNTMEDTSLEDLSSSSTVTFDRSKHAWQDDDEDDGDGLDERDAALLQCFAAVDKEPARAQPVQLELSVPAANPNPQPSGMRSMFMGTQGSSFGSSGSGSYKGSSLGFKQADPFASPPMALSVLGPGKKLQDIML